MARHQKAVYRRQPFSFQLLPEPRFGSDQAVCREECRVDLHMQTARFVEIGGQNLSVSDNDHFMRLDPAVVDQDSFVGNLESLREFSQGSVVAPADVVFWNVVAASLDPLFDPLDIPLDGIQDRVIQADRKPGRLGIPHHVDGLLAAQRGLENE